MLVQVAVLAEVAVLAVPVHLVYPVEFVDLVELVLLVECLDSLESTVTGRTDLVIIAREGKGLGAVAR